MNIIKNIIIYDKQTIAKSEITSLLRNIFKFLFCLQEKWRRGVKDI